MIKAKVTNTSQAMQGVRDIAGVVYISPGMTRRVTFLDHEFDRAKSRRFLTVEVIDDPLDHDGDGRKGGSLPADDDLSDLKAQAKELGIAVHWRWSKEKIEQAINEKLAS